MAWERRPDRVVGDLTIEHEEDVGAAANGLHRTRGSTRAHRMTVRAPDGEVLLRREVSWAAWMGHACGALILPELVLAGQAELDRRASVRVPS